MQFLLSEEQALIRQAAQTLVRDHGASECVRRAFESPLGHDQDTWQAFIDLGLAGLLVPEQSGGQGLGAVEMVLVFEALGAKLVPSPLLATAVLAASLLTRLPHPKARELSSLIASGRCRAAVARTDNNRAQFVLDAHTADALLIEHEGKLRLHRTRETGRFDGVEVERLHMMDRTRVLSHLQFHQDFDAFGIELAEGDQATHAFDHALDMGRLAVAAEAVGAAQSCLTRTSEYATQRVQFGRTIGSFQAVKHQLADMMVGVEAARSAVYYAAASANDDANSLATMAALAKLEASEALTHASSRMIQLHGGIGFTWEHDAHLYFKRARATETIFGGNESLDERIARHIGLGDAA